MAALTEDSVVSSLNELRRMASDRARRESEARARAETERRAQRRSEARSTAHLLLAVDPDATPPPRVSAQAPAPGWTQPAFAAPAYAQPAQPAQQWQQPEPFAGITERVKPRSAAGPVMLTILLLGGAGGAGYWKLQQDFQSTLHARDAVIAEMQQARGHAVEAAVRAEQQAKVSIAACEDRLKSIATDKAKLETAMASVAPAAAAPAPAAAPAAKAEPKAKHASSAKHGKAAKVAVADRKPEPKASKAEKSEAKDPAPMPKVAHKKKFTDDPLAGLKM